MLLLLKDASHCRLECITEITDTTAVIENYIECIAIQIMFRVIIAGNHTWSQDPDTDQGRIKFSCNKLILPLVAPV